MNKIECAKFSVLKDKTEVLNGENCEVHVRTDNSWYVVLKQAMKTIPIGKHNFKSGKIKGVVYPQSEFILLGVDELKK